MLVSMRVPNLGIQAEACLFSRLTLEYGAVHHPLHLDASFLHLTDSGVVGV